MAKKEDKVFIRQDSLALSILESQAYRYCKELNFHCMPLMKKLGIKDINLIVKFCSKGGKQRLREYMTKNLAGDIMGSVAFIYYEQALTEFPFFKEIANNWKWNKYLCLDEEGDLRIKEGVLEEKANVYVSGDNMKIVEKLNQICNILNSLDLNTDIDVISPTFFLSQLLEYSFARKTWHINPNEISDSFIEKYFSKLSREEFYEKVSQREREEETAEEIEGKKIFGL